jgi:hypothetical protein
VTIRLNRKVSEVKLFAKSADMAKFEELDAEHVKGKLWRAVLDCRFTAVEGKIEYYVRAVYYQDKDQLAIEHGSKKHPEEFVLEDTEDTAKLPDDSLSCEPAPKPKKHHKHAKDPAPPPETAPAEPAPTEPAPAEPPPPVVTTPGGPVPTTSHTPPPAQPEIAKLWIGVEIQQDFVWMNQTADICNRSSWQCYYYDNSTQARVPIGPAGTANGSNSVALAGQGDNITQAGFAKGTVRLMASIDYFVTPLVSLGARVGFAFNGHPSLAGEGSFSPFHLEADAQFFFGRGGFRPYFLLNAGVAELDGEQGQVGVLLDSSGITSSAQLKNGQYLQQNAYAWRTDGNGFVGTGLGFWIVLSRNFVIDVGAKLMMPFSISSPVLSPFGGLKLGF